MSNQNTAVDPEKADSYGYDSRRGFSDTLDEPVEAVEPPDAHAFSPSPSLPSNQKADLGLRSRSSWEEEERSRNELQKAGSRRRKPLSRHDSAINHLRLTLSARSTNVDDTRFSHKLAHAPTTEDVIVDFDGPDDPYNPMNWPTRKKVLTTALYGFTTMGSTIASSIYSAGVAQVSNQFHVGPIVSTLGVALLLFGFGVGPLLWGPLSELYGRKPSVLLPYFIAAIFAFGTGAAKDIQTIMITRFFAGFFGSAPVTNTGGVLGDIWGPKQRGTAIVGYALAVIGGPTLGPIIGGALVQSTRAGWRWTEFLTGILQLSVLALDLLFVDETHQPTLLVHKANRLRHKTGNWALHARHEEWDFSFRELGNKYLIRPMAMLRTPICLAMCSYASFVYAIFYAQLAAFPIVYQQIRGYGDVVGALPFLALLIGVFIGSAANIVNQQYYVKKYEAAGNRVVPEARLPPMAAGGLAFTAGLFIFAWTSAPADIPWIASCIGLGLVGAGFFMIFQAALNYLVDTFKQYGASAVAANTFLRSALAGAFPLFIRPMYGTLGPNWAASVFAFVSVLALPIPFLFMVYGKRIRAAGSWSRASVY